MRCANGEYPEFYKKARSRLIVGMIMYHFNGIQNFAQVYGVTRVNVQLWVKKGAVSIRHLGAVGQLLKTPTGLLNYDHTIDLRRTHAPEYRALIKEANIPREVKDYVNQGTFPNKMKILKKYDGKLKKQGG